MFQNSPASKVGIAPGDTVMAIDDRAGNDLNVPFLWSVLRQRPVTPVRLRVLHQGIEEKAEIKLRDLL